MPSRTLTDVCNLLGSLATTAAKRATIRPAAEDSALPAPAIPGLAVDPPRIAARPLTWPLTRVEGPAGYRRLFHFGPKPRLLRRYSRDDGMGQLRGLVV